MSDLTVRRVRFDLGGDDIPFNWHPDRPSFAMLCNTITFFAPGFETFIVDATREAIPLMTDPADIEEANLYLRQEAQHSSAHVRHIKALSRRWPGLEKINDGVMASFQRLTDTKSLQWRLAYTAIIENTFTPWFKVFLDHDDLLFEPADERVASLFLWHLVEEIEHRSSALAVYNAVYGSYAYRLRTIKDVVRHVGEITAIIANGVREHVPAADGGDIGRLIPAGFGFSEYRKLHKATRQLQRPDQGTYAGVPKREVLTMLKGLVKSQGPGHDPAHENLPDLAGVWVERYRQQPKSVVRWYSADVPA